MASMEMISLVANGTHGQDLFFSHKSSMLLSMEIDSDYFNERKDKAWETYSKQSLIRNPSLKFSLLPLGFEIIQKAGTIQEYRKLLTPIGKKSSRGFVSMKEVEYWGLVGIIGSQRIKVRAILRRVGDGNITFWSVMPYSKIRQGNQKLYIDGIEDE